MTAFFLLISFFIHIVFNSDIQFFLNFFPSLFCVVFHLGLGPERERERERERGDNANRKYFLEQSYFRYERLFSQILSSGYCQYNIIFGGRNEHQFIIRTR